ncbi:MAG: helix-hairpin-helix domain-containing protein [Candidatus Neomarinimicrobiota bacterium]
MFSKKEKAIELLEEVLQNFESPKVTLLSIIQKLNRIAKLLDENDLLIWTEIQLGNSLYTLPLKNWIEAYLKNEKSKTKASIKELLDETKKFEELGIKLGITVSNEELSVKAGESGGGFSNIGFIEEKYQDFLKHKKGNDGVYYQSNLLNTISHIRSIAYKKASNYHKKYAYSSLPETNFEILKKEVEDVLFELDPELAELLLLAFKTVYSDSPEEWSQALASCRRFLEKLADNLYPATNKKINGRDLKQENYINRIWAYMDNSIKSETNRDVAKSHVDYLGSHLQSIYGITNKGVHSTITRIEALKTVMHIYLLCADLLSFLDKKQFLEKTPSIYTATLDELVIVGKINKTIAKEIIKLRVKNNKITKENLIQIPGLGEKTLKSFLSNISLDGN